MRSGQKVQSMHRCDWTIQLVEVVGASDAATIQRWILSACRCEGAIDADDAIEPIPASGAYVATDAIDAIKAVVTRETTTAIGSLCDRHELYDCGDRGV